MKNIHQLNKLVVTASRNPKNWRGPDKLILGHTRHGHVAHIVFRVGSKLAYWVICDSLTFANRNEVRLIDIPKGMYEPAFSPEQNMTLYEMSCNGAEYTWNPCDGTVYEK